MTDFDYDCRQKKIIAKNAIHKKNGSRSKRCTLPSDYLTQAQKRKLNGEVVTYKMNRPMKWEEFKKLPKDIAKTYLDNLVSKYDAGAKQIAEMFGVANATLSRYLRNIPGFSFRKAHRMSASGKDAWERFLNGEPEQTEPECEPDPSAAEDDRKPAVGQDAVDAAAETAVVQDEKPVAHLDMLLTFSGGPVDPYMAADVIAVLKVLPGLQIDSVHINWNGPGCKLY